MSTSTLTSPTATSPPGSPPADNLRVTFPRVVRSEWIKFRTLRSTIWTLASMVVAIVGIVTLFCIMITSGNGGHGTPGPDTSVIAFSIAAGIAQLAVAVLGTLVITGEYSTGMIRSTLAAVPRRLPALWAKGVVLTAAILLVSTVAVGISVGVMELFLRSKGLAPDFGDGQTWRILAGVPLYLAAIALLAFAIGALLRHSAGALATVLGLLLVVPTLFQIPWRPLQLMGPFLPGTAGSTILMAAQTGAGSPDVVGAVLSPWQGYGVLLAWVAALLAVAAVFLRRRNA
ncbi:MAG: ABC transporter permease [Actinomycetota bacterium]